MGRSWPILDGQAAPTPQIEPSAPRVYVNRTVVRLVGSPGFKLLFARRGYMYRHMKKDHPASKRTSAMPRDDAIWSGTQRVCCSPDQAVEHLLIGS
jgi:hypothetical protein